MKVLFAVSNENISESIVKKYQQLYKEIILSKNVYYFNAIIKELQKDKTYDRIVISEDLEPFTNNNYEAIDNFIFEKLDNISDEASTSTGEDIPIILITTDRRSKSENLLVKIFGIGVYSALIGQERSIEEVCKLINKPRSKKEAKIYYGIDSNDVGYKTESEGNVSETEIQNILTHYKRLGRNEDRYVESFDNIAAQYTDQQLKVIIKFLPLNVKAILEENSHRYQQLMSFSGQSSTKNITQYGNTKTKNSIKKAVSNDGIKVESIPTGEKKLTKPVIIPSMTPNKSVKKISNEEIKEAISQPSIITKEEIEPISIKEETIIEQPKKGRGRPKKIQIPEENIEIKQKKGRGRPKKVEIELDEIEIPEKVETPVNIFELDDDIEENNSSVLPGFDDEQDENVLPGFDDKQDENVLPGFDTEQDENVKVNTLPENELNDQIDEKQNVNAYYSNSYENVNEDIKDIRSYNVNNSINIENLLTQDKKVVAFVGTTKNGVSFIVNNIAEMLSNQGIKTAILDLTKNRNSYYIYTKNEETLRNTAFACTRKLAQGIAEGIKVNSNLDVYTSLPGENNEIDQYEEILTTLIKNYSLVLLDCDFTTNYEYLKETQEIYLVQSMDVLTIQPLTAYLRDLKAKGILDQNKLRIVINKYTKVRSVTEKAIIGGMAFYNDPAMSFMTELFNREKIKYCTIPFEMQTYSKYLEGLINCNISLNGYSKEIIASLRKLANMIYPLIDSTKKQYGSKYENQKYNKYGNQTQFSNNMNSTLDKMKRNF